MDQQLEERPEQEPPCFPEEIWRAIFQYLYPYQLLDARLVCRHWNRIIASNSTLMDKFVLQVYDEVILEEWLLSTNETKFRNVEITQNVIIPEDISGWTTRALNSITSLILNDGFFTFRLLLNLLKEMPILRSLSLKGNIMGDVPKDIDFKMHSLKELKLEDSKDITKMIEMFSQLCTRLKRLLVIRGCGYLNENERIEEQKATIKLIQANRNTLEWMETAWEYELWFEVAKIEGLRLKRINIFNFYNDVVIAIVRKQSALEDLTLDEFISDETFIEIARNLPQLKSIHLIMNEFDDPSMFSEVCLPQLKHLRLYTRQPYYLIFGSSFPNLHSVELSNSKINNWPELFDSLAELKNLNRLKLRKIRATESSDDGFKSLNSLEYLKLYDCEIPKTIFRLLITQSPDLREVYLESEQNLDDDDILTVCSTLTEDHIINCCQFLEKVSIFNCYNITKDAVHRINTEREEIHVSYYK